MTIPLIVFATLSFFFFFTGTLNPFSPEGWFTEAVQCPMSVVPPGIAAPDGSAFTEALHHAHGTAMLLSLSIAGLGILVAFLTYYWKKISADRIAGAMKPVHTFLMNKWYFDELYEATAVNGTLLFARAYAWFDTNVIDGIVNGVARWTLGLTLGTRGAWDEGNFGAVAYRVVAGVISAYAGWLLASSLAPADPSFWQFIQYAVLGIAAAGLSFFMFFVGIGGFDNRIIDGVVNLVAYAAGFVGIVARRVQTGKIQTYLAFVLLGVMVFFLWFR
jgi:NADH:ubiquinone oxidoreductase subunit 5 (subunit L)/multisubunit Na+/H+ antiporter MnhA subunit